MLRRSAAKLRPDSGSLRRPPLLLLDPFLLTALVRVLRRRTRGEPRSESLPLALCARGESDREGRCLLSVSGPED